MAASLAAQYSLPNTTAATMASQQPVLQQQILAQLAQQQQQMLIGGPQAGAGFPQMASGAPRPAGMPGLYGASPMLYYYPSPPLSPQNYFNAAAVAGELCGRKQAIVPVQLM